MKSAEKELHNKVVPGIFQNLQKTFKKFGQQFVVGNVPVDCQPATLVKREFFKISRRATFRNIPKQSFQQSCRMQKSHILLN